MLLRNHGTKFTASEVYNVRYSPQDAAVSLQVYAYAEQPTQQNLELLHPNIKQAVTAHTVDFIVHLISDGKIDEITLFKNIIAKNDVALGLAIIQEIAARGNMHPSTCSAITLFMEELIEQNGNQSLQTLIDIEPLLPLNYEELYGQASWTKEKQENSWWGANLPFTSKLDPTIVSQLKGLAEQQRFSALGNQSHSLSNALLRMGATRTSKDPSSHSAPDPSVYLGKRKATVDGLSQDADDENTLELKNNKALTKNIPIK